MLRFFLADSRPDESYAFHLLLIDLKMEIVGEAGDCVTTFEQVPILHVDM